MSLPDEDATIRGLIPVDGWFLAAVLSDGTLATLAAAMLAVLVKPRLFPRVTPAPVNVQAAGIGATVLCLVDAAGTVRSVTPNAARILGPACDQAAELGLTLSELVEAVAPELLTAWCERIWLTNAAEPLLLHTRGGPANDRWLELVPGGRSKAADRDVIAVELRDATQRAEGERRATLLAGAMRAAAEAVYVTDADGRIEHVNPAFERISGLRAEAVTGQPASLLASGRHRPDFFARMWETIRNSGHFSGEVTNRRPDGTCYTLDLSITSVRDPDGVLHYVAVGRDITQRRQIEQEIEDLAFRDPLTGLGRVRLLRERSEQILALARRHGRIAALLQIDVDGMRALNARHGRSVGDDVLRTVGERLRLDLRDSDTLARGASDSFLVLLSELADETALGRVVRRLHERITQPCRVGPATIELSARMGIAVFPHDASSFEELTEQADTARRRAAQLDVPFEFYRRDLTLADRERFTLEHELAWAWEHDQFTLHYMPVIAAGGAVARTDTRGTGDVVGVEAVARWRHLERGMLRAAEFQPLVEDRGMARMLDRWAINGAMLQAATWLPSGWAGWVSVNLSAASLYDPDLTPFVLQTLADRQLAPARLVVAFTEETAAADPHAAAAAVASLRAAGVRVALDAFGARQASLDALRDVDVDFIKLEGVLLDGAGDRARHDQLLHGLIELAHRVGARVIAAGVENEDQLDWLAQTGCDFAQGPLIGQPVPPDALPQMPALPAN